MNTLRSVVVSIFGGLLSVVIPIFTLIFFNPNFSFLSCLLILLLISIFIFKNKEIKRVKIAFISFLSVCSLMVSLDISFLEAIFPIKNFEFSNYLSFWVGSVWTGIIFIAMQDRVNEVKQNQTSKN